MKRGRVKRDRVKRDPYQTHFRIRLFGCGASNDLTAETEVTTSK